jgi:diamine N-acetyltransferase
VPGLVIRPAAAPDLPALSLLAVRTWSEAFGGSVASESARSEVATTRSPAYFARALADATVLVAKADGALVGYVQFGAVDIAGVDAAPDDRELHRLYIERAWQGRGAGRALMEAALRHPVLAAAGRVYLQVWERSTPARRLSERFGFLTVGTTGFSIGGEPAEDLVMLLERRAVN